MLALDLFCGGGGACIGMQQAGFEVVGIDNKVHKNYPGHFIQADALHPPVSLADFDLVWASPPCQKFSTANSMWKEKKASYPDLIPDVRELLKGHAYTVIENVPQAPIRPDLIPYGENVGLGSTDNWDGLWRKRIFELSFFVWQLPKPKMKKGTYLSIAGRMGSSCHFYRRKEEGKPGSLTTMHAKAVMGIPLCQKMTCKEVANAVPPPYARYIAEEVIRQIKNERKSNYGKRDIRIT